MELARTLEDDIRERGLKRGDAYLNAADAAKMLRVSTSTANRALQLLSSRKIVSRGQRKGTFVNDLSIETSLTTIRRVQMIWYEYAPLTGGFTADPLMLGLQRELPHAMVQFNFIPVADGRHHLETVLREALETTDPVGIVLTRAPFHAQKAVQQSGVPAVIHGNLWPSIEIPWVNSDYEMIGQLAGGFAIEQGAERVVCGYNDRLLLPGDVLMTEALKDVLTQSGLPLSHFQFMTVPDDADAAAEWARGIVGSCSDCVVFVVYGESTARAIRDAVADRAGWKRRVRICVIERTEEDDQSPEFAHFVCRAGVEEIGQQIARLLAAQAEGTNVGGTSVVLPVDLVPAERGA